jgi:hypothetical protein
MPNQAFILNGHRSHKFSLRRAISLLKHKMFGTFSIWGDLIAFKKTSSGVNDSICSIFRWEILPNPFQQALLRTIYAGAFSHHGRNAESARILLHQPGGIYILTLF